MSDEGIKFHYANSVMAVKDVKKSVKFCKKSLGFDIDYFGKIQITYEKALVPLIFEPNAADLTNRLASHAGSGVLEIVAGTGVALA